MNETDNFTIDTQIGYYPELYHAYSISCIVYMGDKLKLEHRHDNPIDTFRGDASAGSPTGEAKILPNGWFI
ncbi:hypothetical protein KAH81_05255 [bacterium]|nr:hypothetical protein [bacterium]